MDWKSTYPIHNSDCLKLGFLWKKDCEKDLVKFAYVTNNAVWKTGMWSYEYFLTEQTLVTQITFKKHENTNIW